MKQNQINLSFIIFLLITSFFYFWDIGNIAGIRQGTEALYLQISQEMFEKFSIITPYYRGEVHWSKPPLQFWMPFPLYFIGKDTSLTLARASVAIVGLLGSLFFVLWLRARKEVPLLISASIFLGSLGILKFSRTFMMEIPLSLLPAIGLFLFYDYLKQKQLKYLAGAAFFLGLSVLVKGPVTLIMATGGVCLYQIYLYFSARKLIIKDSFYFFLLATFIASIWFIAAYLKHGQEFFDYFFLRENLGKFGNNAHSPWKIPQGLLLYAMPWTLLIPSLIRSRRNNLNVFITCQFIAFFALWFFPAQRSHHYALPALPFFLSLLILSLNAPGRSFMRLDNLPLLLYTLFFGAILIVLFFILKTPTLIIGLILFTIPTFLLITRKKLELVLPATALSTLFLWCFILPTFFIAPIPQQHIELLKNKTVALADRRSYFFEQILEHPVEPISASQLHTFLAQKNSAAIVYQSRLGSEKLEHYQLQGTWKKWKRKIRWSDLKTAIARQDIELLQEDVYLLMPKTDSQPF